MVCRHSLSVLHHSSCRAILKTITTMVMATNTKPQTHITKTSTIKAIMTIRNIRSMASNRKYMGTTIKGMGTVVTMMSRQFAFLHIGRRFTNESAGDTIMPMPPISTIKTAAIMRAISTATRTSTTMINTTIKGRQLEGSNPIILRVDTGLCPSSLFRGRAYDLQSQAKAPWSRFRGRLGDLQRLHYEV